MSEITSPADVISELNRLMAESQKGITALYECEVKVAYLDQNYERDLANGLLNAEGGTAPEKQARAKLAASDAKLQLDIAKAEHNRVKAKLRAIESAQVAVSVISRQVELHWRNS